MLQFCVVSPYAKFRHCVCVYVCVCVEKKDLCVLKRRSLLYYFCLVVQFCGHVHNVDCVSVCVCACLCVCERESDRERDNAH